MLDKTKTLVFLAFVLWSFVLVAPSLLGTGPNVVTKTYFGAAERIVSGQSPYSYLGPDTDAFKYSPLFALLFSPLSIIPSTPATLIFAFLNITVFWLGLIFWSQNLALSLRATILVGIVCSMELDGALRYQQINPFLAGLTLLGGHFLFLKRTLLAALFFAVGVNFKIIPLVFAGSYLLSRDKRFFLGFTSWSFVLVFLPIPFLGIETNLLRHREWFEVLLRDLKAPEGILDIQTVLVKIGLPPVFSLFSKWAVLLASGAILVLIGRRIVDSNRDKNKLELKKYFCLWFAVGLSSVLLLSPRTESPTFVYAAPIFAFLVPLSNLVEGFSKKLFWAWYGVGFFLISFSFNDLWPKGIWDPLSLFYRTKTLGLFGLWSFSVFLFLLTVQKGRKKNKALILRNI